jgi:galactokinase
VAGREAVAFAPGRVNLIGEHTDYNDGLCLPFAIELGITVRAHARDDEWVAATALDLGEDDAFPLAHPPPAHGWRAFVHGIVAAVRSAGVPLSGAQLEISGDLPRGAGLSSSAALEVALALALNEVGGGPQLDRLELAKLCSRVENEWVGAQTGLLDQMACLFARADHAALLDMRDLAIEPVPMRLAGWRLVVADSGEHHEHAASGYNERRRECAGAARELGLASLRDARRADVARLPAPLDRRVLHVIEENERVERATEALRAGDMEALGRLLDASHASLRDLYEVSVPAVERTVELLKRAGAAGARMVGGGFGGSVLALFAPEVEPPADTIVVRPGPAARLIQHPVAGAARR